ncbi:MAG: hypothetical protein ACI91B_005026, partial [Planctomycetota bacterium]
WSGAAESKPDEPSADAGPDAGPDGSEQPADPPCESSLVGPPEPQ